MTRSFIIEPLAKTHTRRNFTCDVVALDRYFHEQVSQDMRRRLANCFVAVDEDGVIAGYYTFSATSLPMTDLPKSDVDRLPRYPVLPAGLIGRLAIGKAYQRQGLGAALILDAAGRASRAEPAVFALIVDAKDENAILFYRHLGFQRLESRPSSLYWPIAEAMKRLNG